MGWFVDHKVALIGTAAAFVLAWFVDFLADRWIGSHIPDSRERYRLRKIVSTVVMLAAAAAILILWLPLLKQHGTVIGLIGAGLAVALREPLLGIAGRIAIFAGKTYGVGDRIQMAAMSGDVIDIGLVYTRMMEIGNWIKADQYSGRIVQFPNSMLFGNPVFNYTRNFEYIWDEIQLDITYSSNIKAARDILLEAGTEYTREFLAGAEAQLKAMQRYFVVADFELKPQVYINVTTNWVGLTMRYVVAPRKRRPAASFLYAQVFARIQERNDIQIGSDTMNITVAEAGASEAVKHTGHDELARDAAKLASQMSKDPTTIPGDKAA